MAAAPHQHFGCWSRVPPWHSPPGLPNVLFFYQESIVSASVLQSTFRRVCSPSWAALINLVCKAVSSALVNVRYYLPESLLLNLDKSRGKKKKRKSPTKGKALKPPAGAATADTEGLDTVSGPLTARAAPSPLVYCLICKGFHPNMRPEWRNIRAGTVPQVSQLGRV